MSKSMEMCFGENAVQHINDMLQAMDRLYDIVEQLAPVKRMLAKNMMVDISDRSFRYMLALDVLNEYHQLPGNPGWYGGLKAWLEEKIVVDCRDHIYSRCSLRHSSKENL